MTGDTVMLDLGTIKWMVAAIGASITALVGATIAVWRERKQLEEIADVVFGADKKTGEGGLERIVLGNSAHNEKGLKVRIDELEQREKQRDEQVLKHGDVLKGVIRGFDVFGSGEHDVAKTIREKLKHDEQQQQRRDLVKEQDDRFAEVQRSRELPRPDPRVEAETPQMPLPPRRR